MILRGKLVEVIRFAASARADVLMSMKLHAMANALIPAWIVLIAGRGGCAWMPM